MYPPTIRRRIRPPFFVVPSPQTFCVRLRHPPRFRVKKKWWRSADESLVVDEVVIVVLLVRVSLELEPETF